MSFTLASAKKEIELIFYQNPTQEQRKKFKDERLSEIKVKDGSFFVNMHDQYMQDRLKSALGIPNYEVFLETTGLGNWVLYNPKYFKKEFNREDKFILRFKYHNYDGTPVEFPINASSMCSMFSWMKIPENIKFHINTDTSNIIDMSALFAGAIYDDNFNIDFLNCSSLLNARYMFFENTIKRTDFFNNFYAPCIINAEYMFAESRFRQDVDINLYMPLVQNLDNMFQNAVFNGNCNLGDNFALPKGVSKKHIFQGATKLGIELGNIPKRAIPYYLKTGEILVDD